MMMPSEDGTKEKEYLLFPLMSHDVESIEIVVIIVGMNSCYYIHVLELEESKYDVVLMNT
jgi:hypothetical protein